VRAGHVSRDVGFGPVGNVSGNRFRPDRLLVPSAISCKDVVARRGAQKRKKGVTATHATLEPEVAACGETVLLGRWEERKQ